MLATALEKFNVDSQEVLKSIGNKRLLSAFFQFSQMLTVDFKNTKVFSDKKTFSYKILFS
jgi:hypothetical protein